MFRNRYFQRCELADPALGDAWRDLPVDDALRQVPDEVEHAGMRGGVARRDQLVQQSFDTRPDAFQASGRREQGIEEGRAHHRFLAGSAVHVIASLTGASGLRSNACAHV